MTAARRRQQAAPADANTLPVGLVVASHRRHFVVRSATGETLVCVLKGRGMTLACGDRVAYSRTDAGGVIEALLPRTSLFYRSDAFKERLIAANVTQVVGVVAPDLSLDEELVNRWIVATEAEGCRFILAANKADMFGFDVLLERLAPYAALGYTVVPLSARQDAAPLRPWIDGQNSVLVGQSGMGKSTILNALLPDVGAKTAEISASLNAGRHTTTHSTLHLLGDDVGGGWIVDSPGMKMFGMAHVAADTLARAFVEFRPFLGHCRFRDCRHDREPGCAIDAAVAAGAIQPFRVSLWRRLVADSNAGRGAR
jgi:ribosome biogenesis GTPase